MRAASAGTAAATQSAQATAGTQWSVEIGTAPNTLTNAAGLPQDVHLTATGDNSDGWHGSGVMLLGHLSQLFSFGQHAVLQANIVEGGLIGIDGIPVLPGTYLAPSPEIGHGTFEVVNGQTLYLIVDFTVVNSNITESDILKEMLAGAGGGAVN